MNYRILFIAFVSFVQLSFGQQRFLELTFNPTIAGKVAKDFTVILEPSSEFPLTVDFRKKKGSIFLAAGEVHTIWITKKGYYNHPVTVDLSNVPKAMHQDKFVQFDLPIELVPIQHPQPTNSIVLEFDSRYKKITTR